MDVRRIRLRHFRFPEPAGQMQEEGRHGDLVRELTRDHERYRAHLAAELERRGHGVPDPHAYRGRYEDWCRDGAYVSELVAAESMLRHCAARRR
jgi:hypothetical protein